MGIRGLVALLCLAPLCLVIDVWLFFMMPRVCLQFMIVVFPEHTHYYFGVYNKAYRLSHNIHDVSHFL